MSPAMLLGRFIGISSLILAVLIGLGHAGLCWNERRQKQQVKRGFK